MVLQNETEPKKDDETKVGDELPWSLSELASLVFSVYNLGEADLKSIIVEDPADPSHKRTEKEITAKWQQIKYFLQIKCPDYEPQA